MQRVQHTPAMFSLYLGMRLVHMKQYIHKDGQWAAEDPAMWGTQIQFLADSDGEGERTALSLGQPHYSRNVWLHKP